ARTRRAADLRTAAVPQRTGPASLPHDRGPRPAATGRAMITSCAPRAPVRRRPHAAADCWRAYACSSGSRSWRRGRRHHILGPAVGAGEPDVLAHPQPGEETTELARLPESVL